MGGIYIDCGSFTGSDGKSGKAIPFVLEGMKAVVDEDARALLARLIHDIEAWLWTPVEFRIAPQDAEALLPGIYKYRRHIEAILANLDQRELDQTWNKEVADGSHLRGPAHQYRCIPDLERAFETSVAEHQPVILRWD